MNINRQASYRHQTRTAKEFKEFKKTTGITSLTKEQWDNIIYMYFEEMKLYCAETGEDFKVPAGLGRLAIAKKKRKARKGKNGEFNNLSINWKATRKKGKRIYNMNYDTDGFFFGWMFFPETVRFKHNRLWKFKPAEKMSSLIAHYVRADKKYQERYKEHHLKYKKY